MTVKTTFDYDPFGTINIYVRYPLSCEVPESVVVQLKDADGEATKLRLKIFNCSPAKELDRASVVEKSIKYMVFDADHFKVGDKVGSVLRGATSVIDGFMDIESLVDRPIHKRHFFIDSQQPSRTTNIFNAKRSEITSKQGTVLGRRSKRGELFAG